MDLRRACVYLFQDPHWVGKLGLATVLNLLPVTLSLLPSFRDLGLAVPAPLATLASSPSWFVVTGLLAVPVAGYLLRITRQVLAGQDAALPVWSGGRGILRDGFLFWVLVSLWGLPSIIVEWLVGRSTASPEAPLVLALLLMVIVVLLSQVILPAAEARLAATGSFAHGMDVRAVVRTVRANRGGYVQLWFVTVVGGIIAIGLATGVVALGARVTGYALDGSHAMILGTILFQLTLGAYAGFVLAHLRAQVYAGANGLPVQGPYAHLVGGLSAD